MSAGGAGAGDAGVVLLVCPALIVVGDVHVLDEEHFVADVAVDQFVDDAFCEQHSVSAGAHAGGIADLEVTRDVGRRIAGGYARSRFLSISLIFQFTQNCKGTGAPKCDSPAAMAAVREAP